MGINYEHIVSKTKELMELKNLGLTINEYKILDIYLSRINPMDESTSKVSFSVNEYCRIMNIESFRVRTEQIHNYLKHLFDNSITEWLSEDEFKMHHLFDDAHYDPIEKKIYLECAKNTYIRKMFFDLDNFQYIKYRLKNTILLNSVYSIKLYLYLIDNKFRGEWNIDLYELRKILEVDSEYYEVFKNFNRKILKKSILEINEQTDLNVTYSQIRVGKKVGKIKFSVFLKHVDVQRKDVETNLEDTMQEDKNRDYFYSTKRPNGIFLDFNHLYEVGTLSYIPELDYNKLFYLYSVVILMPNVKLKAKQIDDYHSLEQEEDLSAPTYPSSEQAVGDYIREKITEMKTRKEIKNKYSYLLAMIQADVKKIEGKQDI